MINTVPKTPKPQRIVLPASAENSVLDMIGAHSDVTSQQLPTTFKPNFPTNMKMIYTAPVTTFHPKGTIQTISSHYPKATVQTVPAYRPKINDPSLPSLYPKTTMQAVSTFHPKATVQTMSTFNPKPTVNTISMFQPKTTLQTPSTFHPKATLQTISVNSIPANFVSTYHPKTSTYKVTQESNVFGSQPPITAANQKYSSRFNVQTTYFTPTVTPTMRPNVKHLLATIGLEPENAETINQMTEIQEPTISLAPSTQAERRSTTITTTPTTTTTTTPIPELTPELKELLQSFGLLTNEEPPAHITAGPFQDEFLPVFPNSLKDESLSVSEFRPLPKSVTASDIEEKIDSSYEIKPDDFSSFKPLPLKEDQPTKDDELESLLKSYGLLGDEERVMKAIDSDDESIADSEGSESEAIEVTEKVKLMSEVPEVDVGFLSPDLVRVLGNIGVKNVNIEQVSSIKPAITRRIDTSTSAEASTGQMPTSIGEMPSSTMQNDYQKLDLLLETIKQLDHLTANLTDDELKKLTLQNFNLSKDAVAEISGPDPTYDIDSAINAAKNEVKRQTNSPEPTRIQLDITGTSTSTTASDDLDDDLTTSKTTEREDKNGNLVKDKDLKRDSADDDDTEKDSSSSSTSSTTEESKNGSITDLASSFGGDDGLDPVSEEPLPSPKKNGFYFFSDWNSFLEVGEDDKDKVIVRFDPKIGDPSPFIDVKIPNPPMS